MGIVFNSTQLFDQSLGDESNLQDDYIIEKANALIKRNVTSNPGSLILSTFYSYAVEFTLGISFSSA